MTTPHTGRHGQRQGSVFLLLISLLQKRTCIYRGTCCTDSSVVYWQLQRNKRRDL